VQRLVENRAALFAESRSIAEDIIAAPRAQLRRSSTSSAARGQQASRMRRPTRPGSVKPWLRQPTGGKDRARSPTSGRRGSAEACPSGHPETRPASGTRPARVPGPRPGRPSRACHATMRNLPWRTTTPVR
jgi:hypothetical protein